MLRLVTFALFPALLALGADVRRPARTALRVVAPEQDPPLDRASFKATLDGSPTKVLRVRGPQDDLVLLVVLDLTGDLTLIDPARAALADQFKTLPENNWIGVLKAQDVLQVLADPGPDREKAIAAINGYAPAGKAGMLTTVESAMALGDGLLNRANVRVAVLYITDSNIYNYREDFTNPVINATDSRDLSRRFPDQLIRERMQKLGDSLAAVETPLYFVHLNYFSDTINEAYQRGLLQVAGDSGGLGAFCRSRGEIPDAVARVVSAAATHWSVAVELQPTKSRTASVDLLNGDRDIPNRARFALRK
jgi:hypothetical protein